jgi:iron-sulfur cluster repair protein YtfE (RIC family)
MKAGAAGDGPPARSETPIMPTTVELIDQLIVEHRMFHERAANLEQVANDAHLLDGIDEAKETFTATSPGARGNLDKLESLIDDIAPWLDRHFGREETILLKAVKEKGSQEMVNAFNALLLEHTDLRTRVKQTKEQIETLKSGALARHRWEAGANDIRDHLSHTRTLLEAHAERENVLFAEMKKLFEA